MRTGWTRTWAATLSIGCLGALSGAHAQAQGTLILSDPLQGSTTGTQLGGTFTNGGWQVGTDLAVNQYDSIYWHIPTTPRGAAEFTVVGLWPNETRWNDKTEIYSMYDYMFEDADNNYGGWRNGPYKHFIRQEGPSEGPKNGMMEVEWLIAPNAQEPDSDVLTWDPTVPYTFHEEWGPDGQGGSTLIITRNGTEIIRTTTTGNWTPVGHSVRIGAPAGTPGRPSPLGAVYSNVKVWDKTGIPLPAEPAPADAGGGLTGSLTGGSTGGLTGGLTGGINPWNNLSTLSSYPSTTNSPPATPPPQYTTDGNNQRATYVSGGADDSSSGGGSGGGGCWAGASGGTAFLPCLGLALLAVAAASIRIPVR